MLYRYPNTLLDISAQSEAQTGAAYAVVPASNDDQSDSEQPFRVAFHAKQSGGASSPTTDVVLQTSADNEHWADVIGATQLTADGEVDEISTSVALGPFVRAVTRLGGGTLPAHSAKVVLLSTGNYRLVAQG
jgi:hypothetical protein